MAKFMVLYQQPKDKEKFDDYYQNIHMPLVQQMPNIKKAAVQHVVSTQNTDAGYYIIAELEFETLEILQAAFETPEGKNVQEDGRNLAPFLNQPPTVLITK